jgi:NAD(P)-dependent dehydrogenase (short-subunit alcohol dehydrogenase family)
VLILGYSALEGIGSALMIPPIYILATMLFNDLESRARAFGMISGMAGVGAAAGPLIGGLITTAISWRVTFLLQAAIVGLVVVLSRRIVDPVPPDKTRRFDTVGAVLSAAGMFFVVIAILQIGVNWLLVGVFAVLGAGLLLWFFLHIRSLERKGIEPLLSTSLFRNRTSNLAMLTQNIQWLLLIGSSFVISVYLASETFERVIEVDLMGVWRTVDAIVARRGHVVVISSVYAFLNGVGTVPYAMSKAAVEQFGRALRLELTPDGASASVAYFGFIDTEMVHRPIDADELANEMLSNFPKPQAALADRRGRGDRARHRAAPAAHHQATSMDDLLLAARRAQPADRRPRRARGVHAAAGAPDRRTGRGGPGHDGLSRPRGLDTRTPSWIL